MGQRGENIGSKHDNNKQANNKERHENVLCVCQLSMTIDMAEKWKNGETRNSN